MLLDILILSVLLSFESKKTTVLKRVFIIEMLTFKGANSYQIKSPELQARCSLWILQT